MAYAKRVIEITINLGQGQFGDDLGDTVTLSGLRASVAITSAAGDAQGHLQLRVWGLTLDMLNQLTTIGPMPMQFRTNNILVAAGNDGSALTTVYKGQILQAWADFNAMPNAVLNIEAYSAAIAAVKPVSASSFIGTATVDSIMRELAGKANMEYINHGVEVSLSNPYFPGTALAQIQSCAAAAGISYSTDLGILAIRPKNGAIKNAIVPVISPDTGMVGYPTFSSSGLSVVSEFIPDVRAGSIVNVQSSVQVACGSRIVNNVYHNLESETPGGAWFTQLMLAPNGN